MPPPAPSGGMSTSVRRVLVVAMIVLSVVAVGIGAYAGYVQLSPEEPSPGAEAEATTPSRTPSTPPSRSPNASGIEFVQPGRLTVCTAGAYPPFQKVDSGGQVVGFDVDLTELLAEDLGVELDIVQVGQFSELVEGQAFAQRKCDLGMVGIVATDERKPRMEFSQPYFKDDLLVIARKDKAYRRIEDLKGIRLGVMTGSSTGQTLTTLTGARPSSTYTSPEKLLAAVSAGGVDAGVHWASGILGPLATHGDLEIKTSVGTGEQLSFPAPKTANGTRLIDRFDAVLAKARQDGTVDRLHRQWFGVEPGRFGK